MNVINVEADHGTTERALFAAFYGEEHDWDDAGWREMAAFSSCVLRPLEWAGLLVRTRAERAGKHVHHVFKSPLWRSALKLDTGGMLQPVSVQQGIWRSAKSRPSRSLQRRFLSSPSAGICAPHERTRSS